MVESAVDYILTPVSANENTNDLASDEAQPPPATSTKTEAQRYYIWHLVQDWYIGSIEVAWFSKVQSTGKSR